MRAEKMIGIPPNAGVASARFELGFDLWYHNGINLM